MYLVTTVLGYSAVCCLGYGLASDSMIIIGIGVVLSGMGFYTSK